MATNPDEIIQDADHSTIEGAMERLRAQREEIPAEEIPTDNSEEQEAPEEELAEQELSEEEEIDTTDEAVDLEEDLVETDDLVSNLEPPKAWSGDAEETFRGLPEDLQTQIIEKDKAVERGVHKKLQETATIRKEAEAIRQEAEQARQEYRDRLQSLQTDTLQLPSESLLDENSDDYDPDAYNRQMARYTRQKEEREQHQKELSKIQAEEQKKQQQELLQSAVESERVLLQRFPSWKDPEKGRAEITSLREYMVSQGIDKEVAQSVYDHRMLTVTWKARQYDRIKAAEKKVKKTSKTAKPSARVPKQKTDTKDLRAKLKESGSMADGLALLRATR